jgi:hypothetical protein
MAEKRRDVQKLSFSNEVMMHSNHARHNASLRERQGSVSFLYHASNKNSCRFFISTLRRLCDGIKIFMHC